MYCNIRKQAITSILYQQLLDSKDYDSELEPLFGDSIRSDSPDSRYSTDDEISLSEIEDDDIVCNFDSEEHELSVPPKKKRRVMQSKIPSYAKSKLRKANVMTKQQQNGKNTQRKKEIDHKRKSSNDNNKESKITNNCKQTTSRIVSRLRGG